MSIAFDDDGQEQQQQQQFASQTNKKFILLVALCRASTHTKWKTQTHTHNKFTNIIFLSLYNAVKKVTQLYLPLALLYFFSLHSSLTLRLSAQRAILPSFSYIKRSSSFYFEILFLLCSSLLYFVVASRRIFFSLSCVCTFFCIMHDDVSVWW